MKKLFSILVMVLFALCISAQEINSKVAQQDNQKKVTKYEEFTSRTGVILKFVDVNLSKIGNGINTYIRILMGNPNQYFLVLSRTEEATAFYTTGGGTAMIEYGDLVEINNALDIIFSQETVDLNSKPEYLVNEFVTDDGFVVGYNIKKRQGGVFAENFVELERNGGNIGIGKPEKFIQAFKEAQAKIEELKANEGR